MSLIKHKYINRTSKKRMPKKKIKTVSLNKSFKIKNKDLDDIISKRYLFISIIVIICFLIIIIRLFKLQVIDHEEYKDMLLVATEKTFEGPSAPRGRIYDRNYNKATLVNLEMDEDIIKGDFELTFQNEEYHLLINLNVIDKTGVCDYDTIPDIINGIFTCNYCEYYNPEKTYTNDEIYCEKRCENYKFIYKEQGCINNCAEYNLFINNDDNKCYKQ